MWFGHDADWTRLAETKSTGECVYLQIYRYKMRGCLKKAYFFSLAVWNLEFTYLDNGSITKNIVVFRQGELEAFPNVYLYLTMPLGTTSLLCSDVRFALEHMSFDGLNPVLAPTLKRSSLSTSPLVSKYVSRSSSIGHELNVTLSQSHSPHNLSRSDCFAFSPLTQKVFIGDLSSRLLGKNNSSSIMAKFITNASAMDTYFGKKMFQDKSIEKGLIIYIGMDSYRLIGPSFAKRLFGHGVTPIRYLQFLTENSFEHALIDIELLQHLNLQALPAEQQDEKKDPANAVRRTTEDQVSAHPSVENRRGSSQQAVEVLPRSPRSSVTNGRQRGQRQSISKTNQQVMASPRQKASRRGNLVPELEPAFGVDELAQLIEPRAQIDHLLVQDVYAHPTRQPSKSKHLRIRSAGAIDETSRDFSDDSYLDELINVQPYMQSEKIASNQDAPPSQNTEESVEVIVDNVAMPSKENMEVAGAKNENFTALWGPMTAREMVHGGSV